MAAPGFGSPPRSDDSGIIKDNSGAALSMADLFANPCPLDWFFARAGVLNCTIVVVVSLPQLPSRITLLVFSNRLLGTRLSSSATSVITRGGAGLVLDIVAGNILEVAAGCRVVTVFHGLTQLPTSAVQGLYGAGTLDLVRQHRSCR